MVRGADARSARDASAIAIDESRWPLLVVRWPSVRASDAAVAIAMLRLRTIAAREQSHAVLLDAYDAPAPTTAQLAMILDVVRFAGPRSRCIAVATLTRSVAARACVDSLRWMALTGWRWETFELEAPAARWLERQLARSQDVSGAHAIARAPRIGQRPLAG